MAIKLVVSDIDGTLIGSDRKMGPAISLLRDYIQQYHIPFTLASGRIPARILDLQEHLGTDFPIIGCNGSCAVWKGKFLWNDFIPLSYLKDAIIKADELGLSIVFTDGITEYAYRKTEWIRNLMEIYHRYDGIYAPEGEAWEILSVQKVLISDDEIGSRSEAVYRLLEPYEDRLQIVRYPDGTLDIMSKRADKGEAVRRLAEYMGFDRTEIAAIGDHENDRGMIQYAGVGGVVSNGTEELKQDADYVCENALAEGVLEFLKYCYEGEKMGDEA